MCNTLRLAYIANADHESIIISQAYFSHTLKTLFTWILLLVVYRALGIYYYLYYSTMLRLGIINNNNEVHVTLSNVVSK